MPARPTDIALEPPHVALGLPGCAAQGAVQKPPKGEQAACPPVDERDHVRRAISSASCWPAAIRPSITSASRSLEKFAWASSLSMRKLSASRMPRIPKAAAEKSIVLG